MPGRTLGRQPPVKLAGVAFGGADSRKQEPPCRRGPCRVRTAPRLLPAQVWNREPWLLQRGNGDGDRAWAPGSPLSLPVRGASQGPVQERLSADGGGDVSEPGHTPGPVPASAPGPRPQDAHPPLGPRPRGRGLLHPSSGPGPGTRTSLGSGFARGLRSLVCREGQEDGAGVPGTTPVWGDLSLSPQAWMSRHPRPQSRSPPAGLTASATDGGLTRRQQPPAWRRIRDAVPQGGPLPGPLGDPRQHPT